MKQLLLLFIFLAGSYYIFAQNDPYSWSVGVRTGASHEFDAYLEQYNQVGPVNRDQATGLHQQLFVNKSLGKKQQWMLEANLSYYGHVHKQEIYGSGISDGHIYANVNQYRNLGIQINGRYAVYTCKSLKWKHYLGLSLNATNSRHIYKRLDNDFLIRSSGENSWHSFGGLEYFGKINLSSRLSIQYNLNYLVSSLGLDILNSSVVSSPYANDLKLFKRINFGFGIGWHF